MRSEILASLITAMFAFLVLGLFTTQVLNYDLYFVQSQNNFIRIIPIEAPRGRILDRNGTVLVTSRLSLDVSCIYQEVGKKDLFIREVSTLLKEPPRRVIRSMEKASERPFAPVTIFEDVDKERAMALEELDGVLRGLVIEPRSKREYVFGTAGAHLFGYLGEINEEELDRLKAYGYRMRELMGRSGLEKYYNNYLMGSDGGEQVEVDSRGRRIGVLGLKEPVPGKDLSLTLDMRLQLTADSLLGGRHGAVIVMDPRDGEILAMASHPAFDPNTFVRPMGHGSRLALLHDRSKPLLNRAISGLYAPGSIFKIVVASAALEMKRITRSTSFHCPGSYSLGHAVFRCWKEGGHGGQNVLEAIKNSCNVFFYNTGRAVGVDGIESYALKFGFGRPTGIDLPEEAAGLVPGRVWKAIARKDEWYEGETVNYAIGQGYLSVTPLQVLRATALVANGGKLVRPFVVKQIGPIEVGNARLQHVDISPETLRIVREGMLKVVQDQDGTGRRARVDGVLIGGKTGTAQNPQGATHAWFTGFAPWKDPSVSIVVIIEHGGKGGIGAADIARGLFGKAKEFGYL